MLQKGMKVLAGKRTYDVLEVQYGRFNRIQYVSLGPVTPENTEYIRSIYGGSGISTKHQEDGEGWRRDQECHIHILDNRIDELKIVESNKLLVNVLERFED